MLPPFKLPVRVEHFTDSLVLVAHDCELIAVLEAATEEEAAYIVHCINAQAQGKPARSGSSMRE